jgi:hypothetical protein
MLAGRQKDIYAKSRDPQGREKTVIDSAMGRNGGNSRAGGLSMCMKTRRSFSKT